MISKFKVCQTSYTSIDKIHYDEYVRALFTNKDEAEKYCDNLNWENSAYMVRSFKVIEVNDEN